VLTLAMVMSLGRLWLAPRRVHAPPPERPLVVVDPGHGGIDPGSSAGGVTEADVNLEVSLLLARALRQAGYRVLLTRHHGCTPAWVAASPEVPRAWVVRARPRPGRPLAATACRINLRDRVLLAIHYRASAFLSIHTDRYPDRSVQGPRTYYDPDHPAQKQLAEAIQRELDAFRRRPLEPKAQRHFVLVALGSMPAVTVELGYLSNPQERKLLTQRGYQEALAQAVARGFATYARTHPLWPPPRLDAAEVERMWQDRRGRLYHPYRPPRISSVSLGAQGG
jgi:N-acetylmuramoyl-L-alanine amidase